ncbi:mechanosensitive ion channel family protein [Intrasporangium sp.]|uniref:mechanosensitive ion channel family protein n=1 Tax=Intrasporangium sp. TaxID=1925024 RepID=UPI0029397F1C|nr:mechanosensitive ion channel family protein [Intrasporangium sp.]MDV3222705.1 mechanosensitive ion channel family protein [Intrasporangium sp.]
MPLSSVPTLTWAQVGDWLLGAPLRIILTIALALVARWLLHRLIGRVVDSATSRHAERASELPGTGQKLAQSMGVAQERYLQRTRTMGSLLRSLVTVVVATLAGLTVMAVLEIPLAPLLASAGVGGVALGFGAQSLVKDFLSGIFMIVEDQYGVGDVIDTGEAVGTVEDVSLRITQLRDANGVIWYVRNGEIVRIGNRSQGWSTAIVDVPVPYDEDIERAMGIIREVIDDLRGSAPWDEKLLESGTVGVESMSGGVVTIRVLTRTVAQEHFSVQRELRERIKVAFDREGVRSPAVLPGVPPYGGPA